MLYTKTDVQILLNKALQKYVLLFYEPYPLSFFDSLLFLYVH